MALILQLSFVKKKKSLLVFTATILLLLSSLVHSLFFGAVFISIAYFLLKKSQVNNWRTLLEFPRFSGLAIFWLANLTLAKSTPVEFNQL